jgi:predicted signal transduction protein with EAL and GGDEF domain
VDGIEIDDGRPAAANARQAVARAVIQLAHALGLDTVAEGVESAEQVAALRELGYTLGQGFHLAEPMTADGVSRLLARPAVDGVVKRAHPYVPRITAVWCRSQRSSGLTAAVRKVRVCRSPVSA